MLVLMSNVIRCACWHMRLVSERQCDFRMPFRREQPKQQKRKLSINSLNTYNTRIVYINAKYYTSFFSADDKFAFFGDMVIMQVHMYFYWPREYTCVHIYVCVFTSYVRIIDTRSIYLYTYLSTKSRKSFRSNIYIYIYTYIIHRDIYAVFATFY